MKYTATILLVAYIGLLFLCLPISLFSLRNAMPMMPDTCAPVQHTTDGCTTGSAMAQHHLDMYAAFARVLPAMMHVLVFAALLSISISMLSLLLLTTMQARSSPQSIRQHINSVRLYLAERLLFRWRAIFSLHPIFA